MNLLEFNKLYTNNGAVSAQLCISELMCTLREFLDCVPELAYMYKARYGEWCCLLFDYPEYSKYFDWSDMTSKHWRFLLAQRPQFHIHCNFSDIQINDWIWIVKYQPQLEIYKQIVTIGNHTDS